MSKDTEVENMGVYTRDPWKSSLTAKPGKNGLESQADGSLFDSETGKPLRILKIGTG